jgi:hypothetical protein
MCGLTCVSGHQLSCYHKATNSDVYTVSCLKAYQEGKEKAIISSHIQVCLPIYESTHDLLTLLMRLIVVILTIHHLQEHIR